MVYLHLVKKNLLFSYFWVADLYLTMLKIGQFILCAAVYDRLQGENIYEVFANLLDKNWEEPDSHPAIEAQ